MQYRVTINIRRKGEGVMDGIEFKTEHFNNVEELLDSIDQFIEERLADDMEGDDETNEPAFA